MTKADAKFGGFRAGKLSVAVIMTGGTIAKSYDPAEGRLYNFEPKIKDLIAELRTDDLDLTYVELMHRDSLDISESERDAIIGQVTQSVNHHDAVVVTHGTDRMHETAEALFSTIGDPKVPVIFTGAMVPYSFKQSDAAQNVTEALLALRLLPPGIYIAFHNRVLSLPGARKDYDRLTFEQAD